MTQDTTTHLTLHRGARLSPREFSALPRGEKVRHLRTRPAKEQLDLIIADPAGEQVVREVPRLDLYLLVKELGETDALELIQFSSAEQFVFMLDLELWNRWEFSRAKALQWLGYLLEGGEEPVAAFFGQADSELLTLIFMAEISVGGGLGVLETDEERLADWDHSFDNLYFITFRHRQTSEAVGRLLDILFRRLHPSYLGLMEDIKGATAAEVEELALQFRSGRLADEGMPELEHALELYAFIPPESYVRREAVPAPGAAGDVDGYPVLHLSGDTLLRRTLARCASAEFADQLNYLISNTLVADVADFTEAKSIEGLFQRVYGYLNIALEHLCAGDERAAGEILRTESLQDLFRLGFSLVLELQRRWGAAKSTDHAVSRMLEGVRARRPRYYRGLDPDGADAFREFQTLADVRRMGELLAAALE
jgi:hypothetical protein